MNAPPFGGILDAALTLHGNARLPQPKSATELAALLSTARRCRACQVMMFSPY